MSEHIRFEELVLPHLDAGYNLARWLTRDVHDAEDVVQDACMRSLKYFGTLRDGAARSQCRDQTMASQAGRRDRRVVVLLK